QFHAGHHEAVARKRRQPRSIDPQVLIGNLVLQPLEEEAERPLEQLERERLARAAMPGAVIAASLGNERERVLAPARESLGSEFLGSFPSARVVIRSVD